MSADEAPQGVITLREGWIYDTQDRAVARCERMAHLWSSKHRVVEYPSGVELAQTITRGSETFDISTSEAATGALRRFVISFGYAILLAASYKSSGD